MSGALFCVYVALNDLSIKICVFLKRRSLSVCSHHLLRPLVPRITGGPVGLWGASRGPRAAPSAGEPRAVRIRCPQRGALGLQPQGRKGVSCLASARFRGVHDGQLSKLTSLFLVLLVARAAAAGPLSRLRGAIPAFPRHLPSPRCPGQPDSGLGPSCPGSPPARQIPSQAGVPPPVASSGPATPCPATDPRPLPDLARSGHLEPIPEAGDSESGRKLQGSAQNLSPASQPCRPS